MSSGGDDPGCQRSAPGIERGVDALPRAKRGELQGHLRRQSDPTSRSVPPPPSTLEHLLYLEEALARFWDQYPIFIGDLNAEILQSQNPPRQQVVDMLMEFGTVDPLQNFHKHLRLWQLKIWSQVSQEILLWVRCDYILGTDQQLLEMVGIRYVRNYLSENFPLPDCLL